MVGSPKYLSDFARVEADVRIVCRRGGFEEGWTRAALAEHLLAIGGSQVWSEITRHLRCRSFGCGSTELCAPAVPFARRGTNVPRRIGRLDANLLGAALGVLEATVNRSRGQAVATLEVRLTLLVVRRYARDRGCVHRIWIRRRPMRPEEAMQAWSASPPRAKLSRRVDHRNVEHPSASARRTQVVDLEAPLLALERRGDPLVASTGRA